MTGDFGVPPVAQNSCHDTMRDGLADVMTELHARARLLSQLLRSARGPSHANGRIYVDVDAQTWFNATAMDCTAYPRLPDTGAQKLFDAIHSHGTDGACTCFTTP